MNKSQSLPLHNRRWLTPLSVLLLTLMALALLVWAQSPIHAQAAAPKAYVGIFKDNVVTVIDTGTGEETGKVQFEVPGIRREGVQAVVDGKIAAVVECNPRFGPKAFETLARYAAGEKIEAWVKNVDKFYDPSNAAAELPNAY